ncbi:hypothetical protein D9M71_847220 [compost metagenome]
MTTGSVIGNGLLVDSQEGLPISFASIAGSDLTEWKSAQDDLMRLLALHDVGRLCCISAVYQRNNDECTEYSVAQ